MKGSGRVVGKRYWREEKDGTIKNAGVAPSPFYRSPDKVRFAAKLRENMTGAEMMLWELLKNTVVESRVVRFKAQYIVNGYIVDFYCPAAQLVIEIDGGIHDRVDVAEKDRFRDSVMSQCGFYIMRFTNEEVMNNKYEVAYKILRKCLQVHLKKDVFCGMDGDTIRLKRVRVL